MCDAVVPVVKPLNDTSTANVFATSSVVTVAEPVPGELFGGDSPGPVRLAKYVTIFAWAVGVGGISTTANASKQEPIEMRDSFMFASLCAAFSFDFNDSNPLDEPFAAATGSAAYRMYFLDNRCRWPIKSGDAICALMSAFCNGPGDVKSPRVIVNPAHLQLT